MSHAAISGRELAPEAAIRSQLVVDEAGLHAIKGAWQDLHGRAAGDNPFLSFEWHEGWWRTFGQGRALRLVAAWEGDRLVGLLPLLESGREMGLFPRITPFQNEYTDLSRPIIDADREDVAAHLAAELARLLGHTGVLAWHLAQALEPVLGRFREAAASAGLGWLESAGPEDAYIPTTGDWNEYKKSVRRLDTYGRYRRRLEKQGVLEFEELRSPEDVAPAFEALLEVSRRTWKAREGTAIASDAHVSGFYRTVAAAFSERGWWRCYLLRLDRRPIAFLYGAHLGGVLFDFKNGFDEEFGKCSPANVLREWLVQRAFEDPGTREINLLGAFRYGKSDWTRSAHERRNIVLCRRRSVAGAMVRARGWLRRLARRGLDRLRRPR